MSILIVLQHTRKFHLQITENIMPHKANTAWLAWKTDPKLLYMYADTPTHDPVVNYRKLYNL